MKIKVSKEDYYKLKCEEWFNDRNLIVYGKFATDREYIPLMFEGIHTKIRTRVEHVESWQELYERKQEALHVILTSSYEKQKEEEISELYILNENEHYSNKILYGRINELVRAVNELKKQTKKLEQFKL
jgi:hypothetical protein